MAANKFSVPANPFPIHQQRTIAIVTERTKQFKLAAPKVECLGINPIKLCIRSIDKENYKTLKEHTTTE